VNRVQAAARVDELLALVGAAYLEGRCPRCEALWPAPDLVDLADLATDGPLPRSTPLVDHAKGCEVGRATGEIIHLSLNFGFEFKEEVIPVPRLSRPGQLVVGTGLVRKQGT
jgi:hypothetical protein